jgi:hypothetical protein
MRRTILYHLQLLEFVRVLFIVIQQLNRLENKIQRDFHVLAHCVRHVLL